MARGFKNIIQNLQVTGFQLNMRLPAYRGLFLSLLHSVKIKVDGEEFPFEKIQFKYDGRIFTSDKLKEAYDVHVFYGDPITLLVSKPGGLKSGIHNIELKIYIRPFLKPLLYNATYTDPNRKIKDEEYLTVTKRMSLVQ